MPVFFYCLYSSWLQAAKWKVRRAGHGKDRHVGEELQGLLERIRDEAVHKAEAEAAAIVAKARAEADAIATRAAKDAEESVARGRQEAAEFERRATAALTQAARDVVLSVEAAVTRTMERIVEESTGKALTPDVLKQLLVPVVEAYCSAGGNAQIQLAAKDREAIEGFFLARFQETVRKGMQVATGENLTGGFQVSMAGGTVRHDFSREAIAEALCKLVRPRLAEIVRGAVTGTR